MEVLEKHDLDEARALGSNQLNTQCGLHQPGVAQPFSNARDTDFPQTSQSREWMAADVAQLKSVPPSLVIDCKSVMGGTSNRVASSTGGWQQKGVLLRPRLQQSWHCTCCLERLKKRARQDCPGQYAAQRGAFQEPRGYAVLVQAGATRVSCEEFGLGKNGWAPGLAVECTGHPGQMCSSPSSVAPISKLIGN